MTVTPIDQPARDAIINRLAANACVEAGAGTGKTTVLVARIVELLRTGTVTVDQLAVITFTEKAAAELSVRVRQRLEDALLRAAADSPDAAALREALRGLHRARVETIHAFAGGLLRERPVEAGLDPQFEIVDQLGATLDFDVAYERWLTKLLDGNDARVARALNRQLGLPHIRQLAEVMNDNRSVLPLAPISCDKPDVKAFLKTVDHVETELEWVRDNFDLPEDDPGVRQLPAVHQYLNRIAAARGSSDDLERLLSRPPVLKNPGAQKNWPGGAEGCRRQKGAVKELIDATSDICDLLRTEAIVDIFPLVEEFVVDFAEERRRTARLTFDDLLLWSRDLVADHPGVREDFRDQYRAVLVDEFQDTDPVQAELVLHLTSVGPETVRSKLDPGPGRLVVVGDPKQSIYRFRRADIAIYDEIKRGPLADDVLQIRQNFRSADGIIAWANRVFDRVLREDPGKQPANVPLEPSSLGVPMDRSPVVVVHGASDVVDSAEAARPAMDQEARTVAATFALARREEWLIRDRDTGEVRPATWRDMAILVPARTHVDRYEAAFAAAGVPLRHEGGKTFFRRQEVRELVSCLHAVDDPSDHVSLVATLRMPMFGCSDEELFLWVAAGGRWSYQGGLVDGDAGPQRVRAGLQRLRGLHRAKAGLSLPELVRRVLDETGAVEHALTHADGRETAANLLKLVDQARDFSASGGGGLRAFTRWLARNRDEDSEETDAGISEETDDVVRLLTIHAAKGLEFPIVALANLASRGSTQRAPIADATNHRLHVRLGTQAKTGWFSTPGLEDAYEAEKELIEAERLRLLYVAVTRARDHLVIPYVGEPKGLLEQLADSLPGPDAPAESAAELGVFVLDRDRLTLAGDDLDDSLLEGEAAADEVDDAAAALASWSDEHEALLATASVELPVTAATSLEKPWRPVVASSESPEATLILGEGPPLAVGDALHRVMELVSFPDAENLEPIARAICSEGELDDHLDEIVTLSRRCLGAAAVRAAFGADQLVRELPFTVVGPDGDGYVTGRIDLLYRVGGDWTVVDYKTDTVDDGNLVTASAHHTAQASAYIEAVRTVVGREPRVVLVFARVDGEVTVGAVSESGIRT